MPFSAYDLRYHLTEHYASFCAYLQHRAKRALGVLATDAFEVDQVVGHVIEQLVRLHILGTGDTFPQTALDQITTAQFYAFLNRSIKNKAIDRLRRYRVSTSTLAELERSGSEDDDVNVLDNQVESLWGTIPFATPEEAALEAASHELMRRVLKECIKGLSAAPKQLQAVIQELENLGVDDLVEDVRRESGMLPGVDSMEHPLPNASQHRDHAHRKLRQCLQRTSTHLAVVLALRLLEYEESPGTHLCSVKIETLRQTNLSEREVQTGLRHLVSEGLLDWQGEEIVQFSSEQRKHLERYFEEGE